MSMPGNNALPGPEGLGQGGQTGRRNCKPLKYINKKMPIRASKWRARLIYQLKKATFQA
jgi:hypothetical protein